MPWFIKHETFLRPASELAPHRAAHRDWVLGLRAAGTRISSGRRPCVAALAVSST